MSSPRSAFVTLLLLLLLGGLVVIVFHPVEEGGQGTPSATLSDYAVHPRLAPEINGVAVDGQPLRLGSFRGKVVLLVFWGHW